MPDLSTRKIEGYTFRSKIQTEAAYFLGPRES